MSKLGMVRGKGFAKKHTRGIKGRCVKWSKGRTRCVRRANPGLGYKKRKASGGRKSGARRATSRVTKGRCVKWSKGRKRCLKRIRHNADRSEERRVGKECRS